MTEDIISKKKGDIKMINNTTILGRLTKEPQIKETKDGIPFISFDVAVFRGYNTKREVITDFIPCIAWRGRAEFIEKLFSKGDYIGIEGNMQTRNYQDKNGTNRKAVELVARHITVIAPKIPLVNDQQLEKNKIDEEYENTLVAIDEQEADKEDEDEIIENVFYEELANEDDEDLPFF